MKKLTHRIIKFIVQNEREIVYQLAIMAVLFIFFSYNQEDGINVTISSLVDKYKFAFFGNYMAAATVINYLLLPYYFKKKTGIFFVGTIISLTLVILIDEFILEQIFFPNTRGKYFPGILFSLLETLPIIIIMVAFKIARDYYIKQKEVEDLKSLVKDSELQFLRNQINPHFLFNNLNNLYAYAIENSPKTPTIILELASVLRYMLYDCKEDFVPLAKEIEHLKNYTALNELQISSRGSVSFQEEICNGNYLISPLVLVVFIENAFKHSTQTQSNNIHIEIEVKVSEDGLLSFSCLNSYLPAFKPDEHHGIGLKNVKKRLLLLYPHAHELIIKSEKNNFQVFLELRLKPYQ